ncbi:pyrroline-5-carboxylate reductase [Achromobacter aloeverae]|uniref:Pyrroline-5-carboxylate reductase n=2 Tax=Achromobacter aloeverae TaxID=1750518 RepID=A0A4Q1HMZ0_9BURK|nr:pyrroline-5-carboxylate reductase [Achromobacter aloeverae]RXN91676.1 pyrroline-5-carboxylate reductase [Achromobacter aloeverae]
MTTFMGGGNMATAIIRGLLRDGLPAARIQVIDPDEATRQRVQQELGVQGHESPSASQRSSGIVVWAIKPQYMAQAATAARAAWNDPLHISVAAGVTCGTLSDWLSTPRVVRTMPNTPALVGQGMTGLYAPPAVSMPDRLLAQAMASAIGAHAWVDKESDLDVVTAISGSGPAYVFYFLEAMEAYGAQAGLAPALARKLALETFAGAAALARHRDGQALADLRQMVTSKGGTTQAAIEVLEDRHVGADFQAAMRAAQARARELGGN